MICKILNEGLHLRRSYGQNFIYKGMMTISTTGFSLSGKIKTRNRERAYLGWILQRQQKNLEAATGEKTKHWKIHIWSRWQGTVHSYQCPIKGAPRNEAQRTSIYFFYIAKWEALVTWGKYRQQKIITKPSVHKATCRGRGAEWGGEGKPETARGERIGSRSRL